MELSKAIEILEERVKINNNIITENSYKSDFDNFVQTENNAIITVLKYVEFERVLQRKRMEQSFKR